MGILQSSPTRPSSPAATVKSFAHLSGQAQTLAAGLPPGRSGRYPPESPHPATIPAIGQVGAEATTLSGKSHPRETGLRGRRNKSVRGGKATEHHP